MYTPHADRPLMTRDLVAHPIEFLCAISRYTRLEYANAHPCMHVCFSKIMQLHITRGHGNATNILTLCMNYVTDLEVFMIWSNIRMAQLFSLLDESCNNA